MLRCTWSDPIAGGEGVRCEKAAAKSHTGDDGKVWCSLCEMHDKELDDCMIQEPMDVRLMLRNWVRASGGAKTMARGLVGR